MFESWSYCFNTPVAAGADLANSFTGLSLKESKVTIAKKINMAKHGRMTAAS